jgi:hypothetical protein
MSTTPDSELPNPFSSAVFREWFQRGEAAARRYGRDQLPAAQVTAYEKTLADGPHDWAWTSRDFAEAIGFFSYLGRKAV